MTSKRISQETFDSVVLENVDEFCMSKEEALEDALKQFRSQGVSLLNIDVTGGIGREEVMNAISVIKDETSGQDEKVSALQELYGYCDESCELHSRNLNLVCSNGAMYAMICYLSRESTNELLKASLATLCLVCKRHGKSAPAILTPSKINLRQTLSIIKLNAEIILSLEDPKLFAN